MSLVVATDLALSGRLEPTALTLEPGTFTALIGPNGSGKTSLLHALAGVGGARGQVLIGGQDREASGPAMRSRLLTYLPASRDLTWPISVRDLIALSGAKESEVQAVIAKLSLGAFADRPATRLSTGERSRALLARALAPKPRLLLLDEPTANLDPLWQVRLPDLIRDEVAGSDRAALVALHDLDSALRHADRVIVMARGQIVGDGAPREIMRLIPSVFGVERGDAGWTPALTPSADP